MEALSRRLDELCLALVTLEPAELDRLMAALEEAVRSGRDLAMPGKPDDPAITELRRKLQRTARLSQGATNLYAGLLRIDALERSGYTPEGREPAPGNGGSFAVSG